MYEAIHGSYPQAVGKDIANPLTTLLSAAMLFEDFGLQQEVDDILRMVIKPLGEGVVTKDLCDGAKAY